ncbi:DUF4157 domain-containing protein [Roseovarius sp. M141]|uniref:eCIS core domain-containing protein n=1 Tax=Roseovarius sp. M141 TaxID=2583806 RepID=UPI0020CD45AD|nr:DUF4157 domain-containing protein [Roseovarius sp. M141]MCQ0091218.1 DUF4157 domain-containing protein [Roseovarius sp. M141]
MSARAAKTPKAAPDKVAKPKTGKRWAVHVNQAAPQKQKVETHVSVDRLRLAALQGQPLPYRQELEAQFNADLGGIRVYKGPEVDAALHAEGAQAAVQGEAVLLSANSGKPIVAHEVAHTLQQRATGPRGMEGAAEAEAAQAEALVAAGRPVPDMSAGLYPGAVAFRRVEELDEADLVVGSDREAAQEFEASVEDPAAPDPAVTSAQTGAQTDESRAEPGGTDAMAPVNLGEPIPDEPVPTFEPAPMPDIEIDEAATAEAEEALAGAEDADGLMVAFKDAPPSVKAMHHDRLEGEVGEMAAQDQASFEADLPEFQAQMSGTDEVAAPEPVQTPEAREAQLEDGAPPPPPEPQVDPTPDAGTANLNVSGNALVSSWFSEGDAQGLGRAFSNVSTDDNEVETSAGARPEVPLEGASDPQRVADQDEAARADAISKRQEATQGVLDGPGPEQVELQQVREDFTMEPRETPQIEQAAGPVEGAADFRDKELDNDVIALFDAHHNDSMASSMDAATAEVGTAVESRNTERDTKLLEAEAEKDRLNAEADDQQRAEVGTRRQEVQDARQTAVDAQAQHVSDVEAEADTQRGIAQTEIDTQVSTAESQVTADFDQAETDAEAEVTSGETEAENERNRQEREAENLSWWERAANWVADQFDKLTKFINDVFDAVRSAVSAIIDAVKEAALALIDLAASAIIAAIEALGEALKAAVNALLAEHFPAIAAALNDAIDSAVQVATDAVNAVAEGLKAAVSALLDALAAGLDAILAVYQAAVNAALAIARAALTGDWGALAKLILEPVLMALGIQPAAFYEVIARAVEALDIIIDDPIGFLSNLVEAFVGGVRKFGGNFLEHLKRGIIGWLTGALGGDIQIPEKFDLMGVLDLARQILGLTVDMIRRVAVRVLGEEAVERIEFVMGYMVELITGGFSALWERIMADLSSLKDMVLDAIKSFLVERVIMAAISWLAGLFSPVGALVKLVMTIWNFIMFLKDQLARIFQVVQTIVNTMWEIATGVLEPAMLGVESVLSRLLPIAIDLLARLLGLGNVAGKVQEIINNVRQSIEDAIVNLINRVLSALTGGRVGGTAGDEDDEAAEGGQIMAPIAVRGGGESHTLSIEDQGETVVPMIRSTPQTLQSWLDGRTGPPFEDLAASSGWEGEAKTTKRAELETLVDRAKTEEAELDRAAEAAEDADNADPATATDEKQATAQEGEQTKRALEQVLEFFGIDPNRGLGDHFADDLAALGNDALAARLRANVLNRLDVPRYLTMSWAQARTAIPADTAIPGTWSRPASSDAILRSLHDATFRAGVKRVVEAHLGPQEDFDPQSDKMNDFLSDYLTGDLNRSPHPAAILGEILQGRDGNAVADAVAPAIRAAADRKFANQLEYDFKFKDVTGSYYKTVIVPNPAALLDGNFGPYFDDDNENTAGAGHGVPQALVFFLRDGNSKRASKNRTRMADAVRGADPGNHEWIPASKAATILTATAARIESGGDVDSASGLAMLLKFQHEVRTPTSKLVFKPQSGLANADRTIPYFSKAHVNSGEAYNDLSADQKTEFYPATGPAHMEQVPVLQAHAGGLDAGTLAGGQVARGAQLQWSSPDWHGQLGDRLNGPINDNIASTADGLAIKDAILGFYRETIWQGAQRLPAPKRVHFDFYYSSSDAQWRTYGQLKDNSRRAYSATVDALESDITRVLQ